MPELSKWIRAERVLRWKTRGGGGGWGFSLGEKTAGQLPELVRVSQRGIPWHSEIWNSLNDSVYIE